MRILLCALLFCISPVFSLNIVLLTTDSWVSKNIRFLYHSLREQGHDVKIIAPLYNTNAGSYYNEWEVGTDLNLVSEDINDGGEFGYLLPVHQSYYDKLRKINFRHLKAKGVIPMNIAKDEIEFLKPVQNKYFGNDPIDKNIWYVNSSPLNSLLVGFDVILKSYHPEFKPDLFIIGPNMKEKDSSNRNYEAEAMIKFGLTNNITSIEVSTEEDGEIYFQDEKYFAIQKRTDSMLKNNFVSKNIRYVNGRISEFIKIFKAGLTERKEAKISFPAMSYDSSACQLYKDDEYNPKLALKDSKNRYNIEYTEKYPKYVFENGRVHIEKIMRKSYYMRNDDSNIMSNLVSRDLEEAYFDSETTDNLEQVKNQMLIDCKIYIKVQKMEMIESSELVF